MSENRLEAVLWDMDGVIADTAQYHYRAWQGIIKEKGATFKKEDFMQHFGQRHDTIIKFILGDKISQEELDDIADRKQVLYRKLVAKNVVPLPGAIELIKSLNDNKIKTAIATSAVPENVDVILRGLGIQNRFQAIAFGTEVAEGKPSPQIFQLAAKKLGVEEGNCVVIEDAIAGVTAAKRAGMKCIAVTNSHPGKSLNQADLVVDTLEKVNITVLKGLFSQVK
jgi:beta-phosphoglucomutase family hydrolase